MRNLVAPSALTALTATALTALTALTACGGGDITPPQRGGGPRGSVSVGSGIAFVSDHNGSSQPAVDTIDVGEHITWTWRGTLPHGVRSGGDAVFASSDTRTGSGSYTVSFDTPGTYEYDCAVHGAAMTGRIVVRGVDAVTAASTDPVGDVVEGGVYDLTGLTIERDTAGVTAQLDFAADVVPPLSGDGAALIAVLDLDLDRDASTGGIAVVDEFRTDGGSTGLGVDVRVALSQPAADGSVSLLDADGTELGRVTPVYHGRRVTVRIPKALLGNDDGYLNAAVIVGTVGRVSDFAPQAGHLALARATAGAAQQ